MVSMTTSASTAIRNITDQPDVPTGAGLRIDTGMKPGALTVAVAPAPLDGDVVLDEAGARLFVGTGAAPLLADRTLDVTVDAHGGVQFTVGDRPR